MSAKFPKRPSHTQPTPFPYCRRHPTQHNQREHEQQQAGGRMQPIGEEDQHHRSRSVSSGFAGFFARGERGSPPGTLAPQPPRRPSLSPDAMRARSLSTTSSGSAIIDELDGSAEESRVGGGPIGRRLSVGARAMGGFIKRPSFSPPTSPEGGKEQGRDLFEEDPFRRAPEEAKVMHRRRHSCAVPAKSEIQSRLEPIIQRAPSPTSDRILAGDFSF